MMGLVQVDLIGFEVGITAGGMQSMVVVEKGGIVEVMLGQK
jgi:hypothetical protein